ncbi:unnamed protein product [Amoebophrya sp. A25]|nr:unnamed protein product [Amoebophrya sp. A25]|eukprot:GSA25T00009313001.1
MGRDRPKTATTSVVCTLPSCSRHDVHLSRTTRPKSSGRAMDRTASLEAAYKTIDADREEVRIYIEVARRCMENGGKILDQAKGSPRFQEALKRQGLEWHEIESEQDEMYKTKLLTDVFLERKRITQENETAADAKRRFNKYIDKLNEEETNFIRHETRRQNARERCRNVYKQRKQAVADREHESFIKSQRRMERDNSNAEKLRQQAEARAKKVQECFDLANRREQEKIDAIMERRNKTEERMKERADKQAEEAIAKQRHEEEMEEMRQKRYEVIVNAKQEKVDEFQSKLNEKMKRSAEHKQHLTEELKAIKEKQNLAMKHRQHHCLRLERQRQYYNERRADDVIINQVGHVLQSELRNAVRRQRQEWEKKKQVFELSMVESDRELKKMDPPGPGRYDPEIPKKYVGWTMPKYVQTQATFKGPGPETYSIKRDLKVGSVKWFKPRETVKPDPQVSPSAEDEEGQKVRQVNRESALSVSPRPKFIGPGPANYHTPPPRKYRGIDDVMSDFDELCNNYSTRMMASPRGTVRNRYGKPDNIITLPVEQSSGGHVHVTSSTSSTGAAGGGVPASKKAKKTNVERPAHMQPGGSPLDEMIAREVPEVAAHNNIGRTGSKGTTAKSRHREAIEKAAAEGGEPSEAQHGAAATAPARRATSNSRTASKEAARAAAEKAVAEVETTTDAPAPAAPLEETPAAEAEPVAAPAEEGAPERASSNPAAGLGREMTRKVEDHEVGAEDTVPEEKPVEADPPAVEAPVLVEEPPVEHVADAAADVVPPPAEEVTVDAAPPAVESEVVDASATTEAVVPEAIPEAQDEPSATTEVDPLVATQTGEDSAGAITVLEQPGADESVVEEAAPAAEEPTLEETAAPTAGTTPPVVEENAEAAQAAPAEEAPAAAEETPVAEAPAAVVEASADSPALPPAEAPSEAPAEVPLAPPVAEEVAAGGEQAAAEADAAPAAVVEEAVAEEPATVADEQPPAPIVAEKSTEAPAAEEAAPQQFVKAEVDLESVEEVAATTEEAPAADEAVAAPSGEAAGEAGREDVAAATEDVAAAAPEEAATGEKAPVEEAAQAAVEEKAATGGGEEVAAEAPAAADAEGEKATAAPAEEAPPAEAAAPEESAEPAAEAAGEPAETAAPAEGEV